MDPSSIHIARVLAEEIIDLRHAVLRAGLPRETAIFAGDGDPASRHFAARLNDRANGRSDGPLDGTIVGCATLHLNEWDDRPAWQLRGMAIADKVQGMGIGSRLLAAVEQSVRDGSPTSLLWCDGRVPAVGFYEKHGWRAVSEVFIIHGVPHRKMIRQL